MFFLEERCSKEVENALSKEPDGRMKVSIRAFGLVGLTAVEVNLTPRLLKEKRKEN